MKYRLPALIAAASAVSMLFGSLHSAGGPDTMNDRQFSFTTDERNGIASLPRDGATAEYKAEHRAKEAARERRESADRDRTDRVYPIAPPGESSESQQAGRAGGGLKTRNGEAKEGILRQTGEDELKRGGQSAGRVSNIPGTTSTSPNATGNIIGSGGLPIYTDEIDRRSRGGAANEETDVRSDPLDR